MGGLSTAARRELRRLLVVFFLGLALVCLAGLFVVPWGRLARLCRATEGSSALYVVASKDRELAEGQGSHIRGRLLDDKGEPVAGARFVLTWCCPERELVFPQAGEEVPGGLEGSFDFTVEPGTYSVKVLGEEGSELAQDLVIPADGRAYVWTVIFRRTPSSSVRVTPFDQEKPVEGTLTPPAKSPLEVGDILRSLSVFTTSVPYRIHFMPMVQRQEVVVVAVSTPIPPAKYLAVRPPGKPVPTETAEEARKRLASWPRPVDDNGIGLHFLRIGYFNDWEADNGIKRLQEMKMKWSTVLYTSNWQLSWTAEKFKKAGIMAVWRPDVAPYERYEDWGKDVAVLKGLGMAPYVQVYNEPELAQEWDSRSIDRNLYQENFLDAAWQVYNAGGFIGLQVIDEEWLVDTLRFLKERNAWPILGRMFFVAHCYGLNHPPEYPWDRHAALGFRYYAEIFRQEVGFVPPIIVGEGGWYIGAREDDRWGPINDEQHRDYHLAVFNWFRTGILSDRTALPDYLFAFTPWLISDGKDAAAWFDNPHYGGERTLTIQAVKALPTFRRRFSWDK